MFAINAKDIFSFAFTANASPFHTNSSTELPIKEKKIGELISAHSYVHVF